LAGYFKDLDGGFDKGKNTLFPPLKEHQFAKQAFGAWFKRFGFTVKCILANVRAVCEVWVARGGLVKFTFTGPEWASQTWASPQASRTVCCCGKFSFDLLNNAIPYTDI